MVYKYLLLGLLAVLFICYQTMWPLTYSILLVVGIAFAPTASASCSSAFQNSTNTPVVTVKNGSYSGIYNPTYKQDFFLGIPYAQPPVNDFRFRTPNSLNTSWPNVTKPATAYSPFCVGYGGDDMGHSVSEDCLYLSVIRPSCVSPESSLPVAVWIHGGGLYMGGSSDQRYNLSFIVQNSVEMNQPMLAVSIQYRLSAWGFLGGKEALDGNATNLGFRDQRLALHWIKENIAAFGGDPRKVTIWGESAGAQSVGAQLLAYNGRDDGLFRAGIAQSGGPANLFFPLDGGYNSTSPQKAYNTLVQSTSCASDLGTPASLDCLRALPFADLNTALNTSGNGVSPFPPTIDNDFIYTYPSSQLSSGNFVHVPLLIGSNSDEGTAFAPNGFGISTDAEFLNILNATQLIPPDSTTASIISALYPNIQALGIPSLSTFPDIITSASAQTLGVGEQYRRVEAYFGDVVLIAPRRASNIAWSKHNVSSYAYRFDVTVDGVPPIIGATHFQEVAFVFNNTAGQGYAIDPFTNTTVNFGEVANFMSRSWVGFITQLNPNKHGLKGKNHWPAYNAMTGGGAGDDFVFTVKKSPHAERDTWRGEGIAWIGDNALAVYGR